MSRIGTGELLLILGIALIIFGPAKLPELGKMMGKAVGAFKKQVSDLDISDELDLTSTKKTPSKSSKEAGTVKATDTEIGSYSADETAAVTELEPQPSPAMQKESADAAEDEDQTVELQSENKEELIHG